MDLYLAAFTPSVSLREVLPHAYISFPIQTVLVNS